MNIFYSSDDNFAQILGVSITSLFENNKKTQEIVVYIIDNNISSENKALLSKIGESYNRRIEFLSLDNIDTSKLENISFGRWSVGCMYRLFAATLFPENIDKVLYIDCDTIVCSELCEMYNTDISDYYFAGVLDCISGMNKANVGLKADDNYFNSGVMLINLKKWREDNIEQKFMDYIVEKKAKIQYLDQGIINAVISKQALVLHPKYNTMSVFFDFSSLKELLKFRKTKHYYSEEDFLQAKNEPVIIHYTGSFASIRPWYKNATHSKTEEWRKYKKLSPWADSPLWTDNRSSFKKCMAKIYSVLPKAVAVGVAGILHSYIKPIVFKLK